MNIADDQTDTNADFFHSFLKSKKRIPVRIRKTDMFYNTDHRRRGLAVIFNHKNFNVPNEKYDERSGTEADCINLENTLKNLEFEIQTYFDLTLEELNAAINDVGSMDFSDCDCLLISVLSHGKQNIICAKNATYPPNLLYDRFTPDKCPTLAGKPKIFVIQACQGDKFDGGVDVYTKIETDSNSESNFRIPLYADLLIAYSTIPGYYSWRNKEKGSWFIQTLCEKLNQYWQEFDILTILTLVNMRVAFDFESNNPDPALHRQKQMCSTSFTLTRLLKFSPKKVEQKP